MERIKTACWSEISLGYDAVVMHSSVCYETTNNLLKLDNCRNTQGDSGVILFRIYAS